MRTKPGVRIVNCARGGLVDEQAVADLIRDGHIAGAAFDVFAVEPAKESPLFGLDEVVVTPHLGASTGEAQENVALQVAEQISDYLTTGAIVNALNMPSVTAEEAPRLRPYMKLAEQLGSFAGQLTATGLSAVTISYAGHAASLNTRPLTQVVLDRPAAAAARQRQHGQRPGAGQAAQHRRHAWSPARAIRRLPDPAHRRGGDRARPARGQPARCSRTPSRGWSRSAASRSRPGSAPHMLYVRNQDRPGLIGALGRTLGDAQINIATFHLGRDRPGGDAIALVEVDGPIPERGPGRGLRACRTCCTPSS